MKRRKSAPQSARIAMANRPPAMNDKMQESPEKTSMVRCIRLVVAWVARR